MPFTIPERPARPAPIRPSTLTATLTATLILTVIAIASAFTSSALATDRSPIRVEGTESVSLRDPVLLGDGRAELTLVNAHETKTAVAWKLDYDRDGFRGSSRFHDGSPTTSDGYPEWGPPDEGQRVEPGGELRIVAGWAFRDDLAEGRSVGLVLDVVVFDDFSFEGDANEAAQIFAWRAEELARRERWMPRLRELVRTTHTAEAALSALERLAGDLRAAQGPREPGSGRPALQQEVHETIEQLRARPEHAVPILEEYLRWAEATTEMARRATPPAYRTGAGSDPPVTR